MGVLFGGQTAKPISLRDLYFNAPAPETLQAPKRSTTQRATDAISDKLRGIVGNRMADKVAGLFDMTPAAGLAGAFDAGADLRQSQKVKAAVGLLSSALSVMPDGGVAAAKGVGLLHAIIAPLWHGSPHAFEKFALEKIGTGEGNQAFGRGLYFAENPAVAKDYQTQLSSGTLRGPDGALIDPYNYHGNQKLAAQFLIDHKGDAAAAKRKAAELYAGPQPARIANEIDSLIASGVAPHGSGHLYEVKLDANPEDFLNWDAPMWKQPEAIQRLMKDRGEFRPAPDLPITETSGGKFSLKNIWGEHAGTFNTREAAQAKANSLIENHGSHGGMLVYSKLGGNSIYSHLDTGEAGRALLEAGVPGTRYFDQGSRGGTGSATRNYVVFDPSIIDILNRH
jgi:hypothetical protein